MCPREDPGQRKSRDKALGLLWDALQESGALGSAEIESEDISTINQLHGAEDVPPPDDELIQRMWAGIQAETGLLTTATVVISPNGHRQIATASVEGEEGSIQVATPSPVRSSGSAREKLRGNAWRSVRFATIATLAGFVTGFFILGGGARIAMRVAAMLSDERLQGVRTENQETVGEITLGGSIALMMTGAFGGIAACIVFMAIRAWLPQAGWKRALTTGFILFAASGSLVLENGNNRDYERFGIAGLNICLFTLLPLLFGLVIGSVVDWFEDRLSDAMPRLSLRPLVLLKSALMCLTVPFALMALMFMVFTPSAMLLLLFLPLIVAGCELKLRTFNFSFASRFATRLSYLGLAVSCLVGLALTAQAVGRIL